MKIHNVFQLNLIVHQISFIKLPQSRWNGSHHPFCAPEKRYKSEQPTLWRITHTRESIDQVTNKHTTQKGGVYREVERMISSKTWGRREKRGIWPAPRNSLSLVVKHSHHMHSSPASLLISRFSEQFIYFLKEREKDQLMPSLLWCCSFRCIQRAIECEMRIGGEIVEFSICLETLKKTFRHVNLLLWFLQLDKTLRLSCFWKRRRDLMGGPLMTARHCPSQ